MRSNSKLTRQNWRLEFIERIFNRNHGDTYPRFTSWRVKIFIEPFQVSLTSRKATIVSFFSSRSCHLHWGDTRNRVVSRFINPFLSFCIVSLFTRGDKDFIETGPRAPSFLITCRDPRGTRASIRPPRGAVKGAERETTLPYQNVSSNARHFDNLLSILTLSRFNRSSKSVQAQNRGVFLPRSFERIRSIFHFLHRFSFPPLSSETTNLLTLW